jgi:hypothetical protein
MPVAQRVLGEGHEVTFRMKQVYATALYKDPTATLDDLREAVTTLEDWNQSRSACSVASIPSQY